MLRQEIRDKWASALESGVYKQGYRFLRTKSGRFCALGILMDILHPELWFNDQEDYNPAYILRGLAPDDSEIIFENAGLPIPEQRQVIHMNDRGDSFKVIAQYIREKL